MIARYEEPSSKARGSGAASSSRHHEASVPATDAVGTALFSYLNSTLIKLVLFKIRCLLSTPFTQLFMVPFDILLFVIFYFSSLDCGGE